MTGAYIDNDKGVEAYYDNETLKECFEKKYHNLLYVLADHYGSREKEYFWFNEAYLLLALALKDSQS